MSECPRCGERVILSPKAKLIPAHHDRCGDPCWATGKTLLQVRDGIELTRARLAWLTEDHTYVRHDAPATSKVAALNVFPRTGTMRKKVLGVIWRAGHMGATRDEIAAKLHMNPNTVRPRVCELIDGGWVQVDHELEGFTEGGQAAEVLVLTEQALEEIDRRMAA